MSDIPYIKLARRFFQHDFWKEKREFSYAEAWLDLIQSARWKQGKGIVFINKRPVEIERGQLVASVRFLVERWNWVSNGRVLRYLDLLEKQNMIRTENGTGINIITICNYETYNSNEETDGTATEQQRNSDGTVTEQRRNSDGTKKKESKESKERKEGKEDYDVAPENSESWILQLKGDALFREQVARQHAITGEGFDILLNTFAGIKIALGEDTHRNYSDFRRNFLFWIPKHLESKKTRNNDNNGHLQNGHLATEQTVRTVFDSLLRSDSSPQ